MWRILPKSELFGYLFIFLHCREMFVSSSCCCLATPTGSRKIWKRWPRCTLPHDTLLQKPSRCCLNTLAQGRSTHRTRTRYSRGQKKKKKREIPLRRDWGVPPSRKTRLQWMPSCQHLSHDMMLCSVSIKGIWVHLMKWSAAGWQSAPEKWFSSETVQLSRRRILQEGVRLKSQLLETESLQQPLHFTHQHRACSLRKRGGVGKEGGEVAVKQCQLQVPSGWGGTNSSILGVVQTKRQSVEISHEMRF